jgi:hypothetical protein
VAIPHLCSLKVKRCINAESVCRQATWVAQGVTYLTGFTLVALLMTASVVPMSLVKVWLFLKGYTLLRMPFALHRLFLSKKGPFHKLKGEVLHMPESEERLGQLRTSQAST